MIHSLNVTIVLYIRSELVKTGKSNEAVLNHLIKQSFEMRRNDILLKSSHASVTLEKYPFLKEPIQVVHVEKLFSLDCIA